MIRLGTHHIDTLVGSSGRDYLFGRRGDDTIIGDNGRDFLFGGRGNDSLHGGAGNDVLFGGAGHDRFIFFEGGNDLIADFKKGVDYISIPVLGTISAGDIYYGDVAHSDSDRIIYNPTTGLIKIDQDGTGDAPAVNVARVTPGILLDHTDFIV